MEGQDVNSEGNFRRYTKIFLLSLIKGRVYLSGEEQQRLGVEYQLGHDKSFPPICASAFCNAYWITHYMRKGLMKELKAGLFHRSTTTNDDTDCEVAVDKSTMKVIKQKMSKDSKIKLPRRLRVTIEILDTDVMLKVNIITVSP